MPRDVEPLLFKCWDSVEDGGPTFKQQSFNVLCLLGAGVYLRVWGGGPRVVVSTAAFHARVRGSVPGLGGLKETKKNSPPSTCESQHCGEPP